MNCYSEIFQALLLLTSGHAAALTVDNLVLMLGNIFTNALVIYVFFFKIKQVLQIVCKLILMLSALDSFITWFTLPKFTFCYVLYNKMGSHCSLLISRKSFIAFIMLYGGNKWC